MNTTPITPPFKSHERPQGIVADTIVLHATAGPTLSGAVNTLRSRGYGYHYIIEKNGTVHKGAPTSEVVAHAGVSTGPRGPGVNRHSIGVCFVNLNDGVDPITKAQELAAGQLVAALVDAIPTLKWITTHYAITVKRDGSARKTDPRGTNQFVQDLAFMHGLEPWKPSYAGRYSL